MLLDEELRILLLRLALCLIFDAVVVPPLLPCGFVVMPVLLLGRLWRLRLVVAALVFCCFEVLTVMEEEVAAVAAADAADVVAASDVGAAVAAAVVGFRCKCS